MTGLEVAGDRAKITNNIFTGFSLFQLGLVGDDYLVSGNFFTSFGFDSDKFSLYILEASSGQIISNVWEDTPGFLLQPGQKSGNWTIKDNQMTIYNTAIDLRPDPISAIAPNQKILAGRLMPEVADRSASWTVEANQIRFESAADRPDYFEKYQYGIYLGSFTNNISLEIKDNYINNANTFGKPSIGIMSVVDTANAKDITIEGNTFINGTWGAYIIGAKPNIQDVFSNNTFDQGSVIEGLTISKPEPVPGTGARHLSY